ncbi:MTRF1L release factor glutamine methyltransferase isoform X1 [Anolis carolinensis]|uniref:peptide chain release factor N(5)-glutamine methyltransferase n=1 Tax=Anolis carolinensis TaxID=28377 RepID=R4GAD1_ANOCA|nr:PREDICTED: hemK methyltransferase family member 1 isoform X1 [Anolis carolinensis]XP_008103265.1 PREDICTED: hemK methyltransferase family member 1 isoform X1 [Anolis carolinensis]XP_008103267.1 PREDICTED: hemK methyltransferase family member 1 isoform X1 [Anolis carolinensis]|eukprot:XP_008103264.1 PREDICTED: hemK methyltransferase family member 1 isoform X1 [Anolis carolinensis]
MTVFYSSLWRKLWCLSPYCGHLGVIFARGCVLHPCHRLLRQYSHSKAGLVTAAELVSYWQDVFEANEIPEARASSEYIVSYVLGAKTFQSLNAGNISPYFSVQQQEQVEQLCAKRLQRMPVQYVLGEWDFQDLTLKMKPPVFIPRRETEELVTLVVDEECRKRLPSSDCKEPRLPPETHGPVILEVGCGSGAIALSLLKKLPHSKVIAIDKLEAAVNLTKENAERLNLQERVSVLHHEVSSSSWKYLLPWGLVDTIISNPPYVFHEDMTHLATEIHSYEDLGALDGGSDGMNIIREILHLACYLLKDYGSVFLEVEPRHPEMVKNWLRGHPDLSLVVCGTHKDFCGKLRFLHIQKHGR